MALKTAHIPIRSCKSCRKRLSKATLQRWILLDTEPRLDVNQNISSRAIYVCSEDCYNSIKANLPKILTRRRV